MIYCTVSTNQYLFFAIVLAKSIKQADPEAKVLMCLIEEDYSYSLPYLGYFDYVILAKELGFPNFYRHMFKHPGHEAAGSCKARLMLYAKNIFYSEDKFVFLDSDMKVFGPFDEIKEELNLHSVILSPHILEPGINENYFSVSGNFNTGFFAIRRSEESNHFLNWWADRIEKACFNEPEKGFFCEQKWLDHAPAFFNANICRHPGYNVAWWNLHQRRLERSITGEYKVNGQPLRLFHFSGILYKNNYTDFLNKYSGGINGKPELVALVNQFLAELKEVKKNFSKIVPWSYENYSNGKRIEMDARLAFRQNPQMFAHITNPFLESNYTFIQKEAGVKSRKRVNRKSKIKLSMQKLKNTDDLPTAEASSRSRGRDYRKTLNIKRKLKVNKMVFRKKNQKIRWIN